MGNSRRVQSRCSTTVITYEESGWIDAVTLVLQRILQAQQGKLNAQLESGSALQLNKTIMGMKPECRWVYIASSLVDCRGQ